jgi:hypothetical protein
MTQLVRNARDERRFGTDDDEIGIEGGGEVEETFAILGSHGMALPEPRDARVARRRVQLFELRVLAQLPRECVLATSRAHEENFHTRTLARRRDGFDAAD